MRSSHSGDQVDAIGDYAGPPCRGLIPRKPRHLELRFPVERHFANWQTRSWVHPIRIAAQRGTASSFRWRSIAVLANSQTCARSIANFYLANEPILAPSRRHSINHAPFHARTSIIPWCRCRRSRKAISRELLQARGDLRVLVCLDTVDAYREHRSPAVHAFICTSIGTTVV